MFSPSFAGMQAASFILPCNFCLAFSYFYIFWKHSFPKDRSYQEGHLYAERMFNAHHGRGIIRETHNSDSIFIDHVYITVVKSSMLVLLGCLSTIDVASSHLIDLKS